MGRLCSFTDSMLVSMHAVVLKCRYYAPDILRPGQYNTMVWLPIVLSELMMTISAVCLCPSGDDAWSKCTTRASSWCTDTVSPHVLQIQGESWKVVEGTNHLVQA